MSDRAEQTAEVKDTQTQAPSLVDFEQFRDFNSSRVAGTPNELPSSLTFPPLGDTANGARFAANAREQLAQNSGDKNKLALAGELVVPPLDLAAGARAKASDGKAATAGSKDSGAAVKDAGVAKDAADVKDKTDKPLPISPDGKIEITDKDFERIGPKAAKVLRDAGVEKITITHGPNGDTYEAKLKNPLEIKQDPDEDGCRKLKIGTSFKADVQKNSDGSFTLNNIEGLKAETKILFKWQDATVNKIQLKSTDDGKSEITSTGSWKSFSRDNTRVKDGEIFKTAELLFGRMKDMTDAALKAAGK